jgi:hypothetical protein
MLSNLDSLNYNSASLTLRTFRYWADVRDMGSSPVGVWHNSSNDFNTKTSQQLSSSLSKLPLIFKIHQQALSKKSSESRANTNARNQNKSKRVASATKYIYDLGPLLPHLFSFWREEANMLLLYREKKE